MEPLDDALKTASLALDAATPPALAELLAGAPPLVVSGDPALAGPALPAVARPRPERCPELVYLAGLRPSGRRSMAARLKGVAALFGGAMMDAVPWEHLRY